MSFKVISGSEPRFHLYPKPYQTTGKSMLEAIPHHSFNTHLTRPSLSIKTRPGSYRIRAKAAVNDLCTTAAATESFYDLLGISESGTLSEIKRAYKQLARKFHPDVSPPNRTEEYTKRFIQVQEAYETLSDPQTRALYDIDLAKGLHLAFSARKRFQQHDQRSYEEEGGWRNRWQSQLMELKRRSMNKDSRRNMSWGARMRRQRSETFVQGLEI